MPNKYDIRYNEGPTIDYHYCRSWDEDDTGCYGTNPNHGYTFEEAKSVIVDYLKRELSRWESLTEEQWENRFVLGSEGYDEDGQYYHDVEDYDEH